MYFFKNVATGKIQSAKESYSNEIEMAAREWKDEANDYQENYDNFQDFYRNAWSESDTSFVFTDKDGNELFGEDVAPDPDFVDWYNDQINNFDA